MNQEIVPNYKMFICQLVYGGTRERNLGDKQNHENQFHFAKFITIVDSSQREQIF